MRTAGIIAEYNPFHRGHEYQIQYTKEKLGADYVIIAMSGDYVQRGTPALLAKHARADMALRCGADLVLELPVSVCTASAEAFAMGGVSLLDGLGVVDLLCFGSESGEISALKELAEILVEEPEKYKTLLKNFLSQGLSFPAARSQALTEYFKNPRNFSGDDFDGVLTPLFNEVTRILNTPNNILGIEYCKALLRLGSSIRPVTIRREGMGYHDTLASNNLSDLRFDPASDTDPDSDFPSACAIRKLICDTDKNGGKYSDHTGYDILASQIPSDAFDIFKKVLSSGEFLTEDALNSILSYCLLQKNVSELASFLDVSENLAQRIVNQKNLLQGFLQSASVLKTKELTQTRIQRALLHIILGIHQVPDNVPYARVLGFRRESSSLLKEIKTNSCIPVITKLADAPSLLDCQAQELLKETTFASNLYGSLIAQKSGRKFIHEYEKQIIII